MNVRFLAAAGPKALRTTLEGKLAGSPGPALQKVLSVDALSVWATAETPVVPGHSGQAVLLGLLFDRASNAQVRALPVAADLPRTVVRDCWGPYILFATDGADHLVLRDPSGAIPAYYGQSDGLDLYASDAAMLALAWPQPFQADLEAVRQWLSFPFLRTRRTGATDVRELLPGTARWKGQEKQRIELVWSPVDQTSSGSRITSFEQAAELLREEALRTIPRFASDGKEVALYLSGGLDSSIVAAALAHSNIPFRAITFATRSADGDERRFARDVAERFGVELIEVSEEEPVPDFGRVSSPFRPPPSPLLQPLHRALAQSASSRGMNAILGGAGGDNVFAYLTTASPALDAWRVNGTRAALESLRDIAALHGCTFWSAARSAFRRARSATRLRWRGDDSFLAPDAVLNSPESHPWLSTPERLLPGTADHIRMIVGIHHFLADPADSGPISLHPLLAQPLMELCLRIPTWLWVSGGHDRAVARSAFRGLLPDSVLDRRGKGSLESMFMKGYTARKPALEGLLVDGVLASRGIIDRGAVLAYLRQPQQPRDSGYIRLLEIAASEQWLRSF